MDAIEWKISDNLVPYEEALSFMEERVDGIIKGAQPEMVWLLEHPPLYTAGTSARHDDLLVPDKFPVFNSGRGGQYTYHGPGQRVAYIMLDLKKRNKQDIKLYVSSLEQVIINVLKRFNIEGMRRDGRVGIWIEGANTEKKIAAIGIRVRRWVTFHGIAINICPELENFNAIVPCGIKNYGVTSLKDLGVNASVGSTDVFLQQEFEKIFI